MSGGNGMQMEYCHLMSGNGMEMCKKNYIAIKW